MMKDILFILILESICLWMKCVKRWRSLIVCICIICISLSNTCIRILFVCLCLKWWWCEWVWIICLLKMKRCCGCWFFLYCFGVMLCMILRIWIRAISRVKKSLSSGVRKLFLIFNLRFLISVVFMSLESLMVMLVMLCGVGVVIMMCLCDLIVRLLKDEFIRDSISSVRFEARWTSDCKSGVVSVVVLVV